MSMYASKDKYESGDVARIIWEQLGGNKFRMMTGAKNLLNLGDGLAMKLGRNSSNSNYLKITLNSMDLYDMKFAKLTRMGELKSVKEYDNVEVQLSRGQAEAWIFSSVGVTAEDRDTVCYLAGIDPGAFKSFARQVIKTKEKTFIRKRINAILHEDNI